MNPKAFTALIAVITLIVGFAAGYATWSITATPRTITTTYTVISTTTVVSPTTVVLPTTLTATLIQTLTQSQPVSIVDALGRVVVFDEAPKRVVSTMPSITEMLFALGLGDRVVGVTTYCNYPPEVVELVKQGGIQTVGGPWTLDLEKIAALRPDLVLLSVSPHARLKDKFEEMGLRVVFLKSNTAQNNYEIYSDIMTVAKIFGVEDRARQLVESIQSRIDYVTSRLANASKPKVLWLVGPPSWGLYSAGGNTFIGWLISQAGGVNIASTYTGWPQLDYEFILFQNPDIIIVTAHGVDPQKVREELAETPLVNTNAWRSGRVYLLTDEADDIVSRPGPRIADALELLAKLIHPEIFGEAARGDVFKLVGQLAVQQVYAVVPPIRFRG